LEQLKAVRLRTSRTADSSPESFLDGILEAPDF